jgi:hypothetical protein
VLEYVNKSIDHGSLSMFLSILDKYLTVFVLVFHLDALFYIFLGFGLGNLDKHLLGDFIYF